MEGLILKYRITKADGTPVNPKAKYFVLRYDANMKDKEFLKASCKALQNFCIDIVNQNPILGKELWCDIADETFKQ